jgi:TRAP-type C4-dicarboxylate transport system permease small subunit
MSLVWSNLRLLAHRLALLSMFAIFAIFIYGVGMRYAGHPPRWVDEVVTILAAWVVFFTSAFVLKWSEFIAFNMVFRPLPPKAQRISMTVAAILFIGVFGYIFYTLVDFVMFMRISTTDMLEIRLDYIYAIFPVFIAAICIRLAVLAWQLTFGDHRAALAELSPVDSTDEVSL